MLIISERLTMSRDVTFDPDDPSETMDHDSMPALIDNTNNENEVVLIDETNNNGDTTEASEQGQSLSEAARINRKRRNAPVWKCSVSSQ